MRGSKLFILTLMALLIRMGISATLVSAGETTYPWPSFRHDLLNTGAAVDSGYPTEATILWKVDRADRPDVPGEPAGARGPVVIDKGLVFTTGRAIIQANDQFTGALIWSKAVPTNVSLSGIDTSIPEPDGAPTDWCYNNIPKLLRNTGICYVPDMADCPSWCFECTTEEPDCPSISLINPLKFSDGYAQFLTGPTLDPSYGDNGCVIFGTFDGRVISLDMSDGTVIWEKTPYKDSGGPNDGAPWYNQKFAWHLSPPSIADGKVYIGTFLPSFYAVFRPWPYTSGPDYPWPSIENDEVTYRVGHDGWFYSLDESDGSILWTWNPRGCGIGNIPPVDSNGNVFVGDDFHAIKCMGLFKSFSSNGVSNWTHGPSAGSQGGSPSISGNTIFPTGGDGVLWALDINTGQVKWTYQAGYNVKGVTGITSSTAVDETNGWVLGTSDTGHIFVLDKDTGRVVREAFLGVPSWNVGDPHPSSGQWFSGTGSMAIVPSQKLLYIDGTDYDRAWQGMWNEGREKLFCYDYGSGNTLTLLWEYQFCKDNDVCATENDEYLVRGMDVSGWYSIGSPALADGHVYYAANNGKIYCFGSDYD